MVDELGQKGANGLSVNCRHEQLLTSLSRQCFAHVFEEKSNVGARLVWRGPVAHFLAYRRMSVSACPNHRPVDGTKIFTTTMTAVL